MQTEPGSQHWDSANLNIHDPQKEMSNHNKT